MRSPRKIGSENGKRDGTLSIFVSTLSIFVAYSHRRPSCALSIFVYSHRRPSYALSILVYSHRRPSYAFSSLALFSHPSSIFGGGRRMHRSFDRSACTPRAGAGGARPRTADTTHEAHCTLLSALFAHTFRHVLLVCDVTCCYAVCPAVLPAPWDCD